MIRTLLTLTALTLTAGDLPAVKPLDDDYVAVRQDVFVKLDAADRNLEKCEVALTASSDELDRAQAAIDKLHASAKQLEAQKRQFEDHVARLESVITRYRDYTASLAQVADANEPSAGEQILDGWEEVDGVAGLVAGWSVGTAQCIGLLYVVNQPAFGGTGP